MKYVGNGYSPAMLTDPNVIIIQKELEYDEFEALSYDANSVMGRRDLAMCLGLDYNPVKNIRINPGDCYLMVYGEKGKIPKGIKDIDDIPEGIEIKFVRMEIIKH